MRRYFVWGCIGLVAVMAVTLALLALRQQQGIRRAEQLIADFRVEKVGDIGSTEVLKILPLMRFPLLAGRYCGAASAART